MSSRASGEAAAKSTLRSNKNSPAAKRSAKSTLRSNKNSPAEKRSPAAAAGGLRFEDIHTDGVAKFVGFIGVQRPMAEALISHTIRVAGLGDGSHRRTNSDENNKKIVRGGQSLIDLVQPNRSWMNSKSQHSNSSSSLFDDEADKIIAKLKESQPPPEFETQSVNQQRKDLRMVYHAVAAVLEFQDYLSTKTTTKAIDIISAEDSTDTAVPVLIARSYFRECVLPRLRSRFFSEAMDEYTPGYTTKDIFPLPQYIDLTTVRHTKTRYVRMSFLLAFWFLFFASGLLYLVAYRQSGIAWVHYDSNFTLRMDGCRLMIRENPRPVFESITYTGVAWLFPLPDRCKGTSPCYFVWYGASRWDGSWIKYDESENTMEISRPTHSKVGCAATMTYDQTDPIIAGLRVIATGGSRSLDFPNHLRGNDIVKIQARTFAQRAISHYELKIDRFEAKISNGNIRIANLHSNRVDIGVEAGEVHLMGFTPSVAKNSTSATAAAAPRHNIQVGQSLGTVAGVGRYAAASNQYCPASRAWQCVELTGTATRPRWICRLL